MKLAVGIIAILWSLWLLYIWVRHHIPMLHELSRRHTVVDIILDIIVGLGLLGGVCVAASILITGGSWLWVIQILIVILLWMGIIDHGPGW